LKPSKEQKPGTRRRIKVHHTGEALTSTEALQRLEASRAVQNPKPKQKKKRGKKDQYVTADEGNCTVDTISGCHPDFSHCEDRDIDHCFSCAELFDDENDCLGCDMCWRWFNYYCVGFEEMIPSSQYWSCPICDQHD
jgi:hypothetical protein